MSRAHLLPLVFALAGKLGAFGLAANPAAALFRSPVTMSELCRMAPEKPVSARACTFLTSSAMVPDLQIYTAAAAGSAGLMALLEMSE